jgi:hypothetical protein
MVSRILGSDCCGIDTIMGIMVGEVKVRAENEVGPKDGFLVFKVNALGGQKVDDTTFPTGPDPDSHFGGKFQVFQVGLFSVGLLGIFLLKMV